jgi:hypothetical protein
LVLEEVDIVPNQSRFRAVQVEVAQLVENELVDEKPNSAVLVPDCGDPEIGVDMVMIREDLFASFFQSHRLINQLIWAGLRPKIVIVVNGTCCGNDSFRVAVILEGAHRRSQIAISARQIYKSCCSCLLRGFKVDLI